MYDVQWNLFYDKLFLLADALESLYSIAINKFKQLYIVFVAFQ